MQHYVDIVDQNPWHKTDLKNEGFITGDVKCSVASHLLGGAPKKSLMAVTQNVVFQTFVLSGKIGKCFLTNLKGKKLNKVHSIHF